MFRRRRYLIKPGFQLRYTGVILLCVFAIAGICIATTYYSSISLLGGKLSNVYPQGRLSVIMRQINAIMILRIMFILPLVIIIGIFLSHRIAGPAHRIERTLREIGKGNFDIYIKLRKYDEMVGIANAINDMVAGLKRLWKAKKADHET